MMGKRTTGNLTEIMPKQCHENEEHMEAILTWLLLRHSFRKRWNVRQRNQCLKKLENQKTMLEKNS